MPAIRFENQAVIFSGLIFRALSFAQIGLEKRPEKYLKNAKVCGIAGHEVGVSLLIGRAGRGFRRLQRIDY